MKQMVGVQVGENGISVSRIVRSVVEHVLLEDKWLQSREGKELGGAHAQIMSDYASAEHLLAQGQRI
ncbi:MAG: hypothetical protein ACOYJ2_00950 [Rickettsiales bacterium]